jgi:hypothetical protein
MEDIDNLLDNHLEAAWVKDPPKKEVTFTSDTVRDKLDLLDVTQVCALYLVTL